MLMFIYLTCEKLSRPSSKGNSWMPIALSPLTCHWAGLSDHPPSSRDHTCPQSSRSLSSYCGELCKWGMAKMALGVPLCLREGHCQPDGGL